MKRIIAGSMIASIVIVIVCLFKEPDRSGPLNDLSPQIENLMNKDTQSHRLYRAEETPEDGFYKAFEKVQNDGNSQIDIEAPDSWESIGPVNQGGRTIALEVDPNDPNTVYAGAASGGLWKLTSTGDGKYDYSWERIETGFPVLGVGSIAIDPRDSDVIYIGTGEAHMHRDYTISLGRYMYTYGIGILKSTDGGDTWSKSLDWSYNQSRGVPVIELNPDNPDRIFAGTTEGLYRSVDAGASWELVLDVLMVMDIDIDPSDPDRIFAGCGNVGTPESGIYRSTDGGDSWERLSEGLPPVWTYKTRLEIYKADPRVIFANIYDQSGYMGLYRSDDSGDSWTFVSDFSMGNIIGLYAHYVRVNPADKNKIFRTNQYYGYSEDGGVTYTVTDDIYGWLEDSTVMHVDHHTFANHPDDPDMFYAGNDGGVFRTYDSGKTFQNLNYGYVTAQFYTGFSSSRTDPDHAIGGTQDNGTFMYTGGPEWRICVLGSDGGTTAISEEDNDIVYALQPRLSIFRSTDRGNNFSFIGPVDWYDGYYGNPHSRDPHSDEKTKFPHPFELLPSNLMYATTNYVYRSKDGGTTWECMNNDKRIYYESIISMAVSRINTGYLYAATYPNSSTGYRAQVFRSKNGGESWENITNDLPDRYIHVYISPHSENVVYATTYGFGTSHLFRTLDAGETWEDIGGGLPDVPTVTVEVDPEFYQNIYVGNDLGVWVSIDDGNTWNQFKMGMPTAALVTDLSISDSNRKIRASTHGYGVYERSLLEYTGEIVDDPSVPVEFELAQNYPNPFNSQTTIPITIYRNAKASVKIYNTKGQLVKTFPEKDCIRGINKVVWDGRNDNGLTVSSGVYMYRIIIDNISLTKKMTVVK
ncbi:T9SS type A sorting domain-containing protein [candidate division KSB1 bacterium]